MDSELDYLKSQSKTDFDILKKWTTGKMNHEEALVNLESLLSYQIQKMLDHQMSKLMDILYQADVSEQAVRDTFSSDRSSREISQDIAKIYLLRLQKKWKTRQEFKTSDIGDWD